MKEHINESLVKKGHVNGTGMGEDNLKIVTSSGLLGLEDVNKETISKLIDIGNTKVLAKFMASLNCKLDYDENGDVCDIIGDEAEVLNPAEELIQSNCFALLKACSSYR